MNNSSMGDKEILSDSLSSQKFIAGNYDTFANECVNANLRNDFMNILREEHDIQNELFNEMQKRGWYQVKVANPTDVQTAKQKYSSMG